MTLAQFLTAAALSVPAAGCAWTAARVLERRLSPRAGVLLWRAGRLALAAPFVAFAVAALVVIPSSAPAVSASAGAAAAPASSVPIFQPALDFVQAVGGGVPAGLLWLTLALYMAGLGACIARMASRRRVLNRILASSRPADGALAAIAARWRSALSVRAHVAPLRLVDADISPFVAGVRPVVIAPASLTSDAAGEAAIAHELTHVKRGDERDRLVGECLAALFWFNPFTRAVERRLASARELACDAEVLDRAAPAMRRAYAAAIAQLAPVHAAATPFLSDLPDLRRRRVKAALAHDGHRPRRVAAALAGALVLAAGLPVASLAAVLAERVQDAAQTPRTSEVVGEALLRAQEASEAGNFEEALGVLDSIRAETPYELSIVNRLRARNLYELDRIAEAAQAFEAVIETGALTLEEEHSARVNVMQLYAVMGAYDQAVATIEQLMATGFEPSPRVAKLFAQVYVQVDDPARALPFAEQALNAMTRPSRSDLTLLQYVYLETGRDAEAEAVSARIAALEEN